ncbi:hypothetical protein ACET3Z_020787 [Daucus carota]
MALTTRLLFNSPTKPTHFLSRPIIPPCGSLPLLTRTSNIVTFAKRTRKFESRNKTSSTSTKEELLGDPTAEIGGELGAVDSGESFEGYVLPDLPGLEKDFWEGPEWDGFGFFIQYMWAFGIVFALISSGIAVATYNEGATDFKATPAYQESIQSQELLEEPDESNSDVFESNPTEQAPSLE